MPYFLEPDGVGAVFRDFDPTRGPGWRAFGRPRHVLVAHRLDEVAGVLAAAEETARGGAWSVGWVAYEAAPAFDPKLQVRPSGAPLAWFGVHDDPVAWARELAPTRGADGPRWGVPEMGFARYGEAFSRVRRALAEGESYQINLTYRMPFEFGGGGFELLSRAAGAQPPPFAAWIRTEACEIVSLSPELFFEKSGRTVTMRPMKGTAACPDRSSVREGAERLRSDPKTLAENLMIVDMVRNDLGRLADVGSVEVRNLFRVEVHRTVLQMTSEVACQTDAGVVDLFRALFPCASVTGAPKVAACGVIAEAEASPRGVYCGAIGFIRPGGDARFSVAIRTADLATGRGVYGVGSGVVWDSVPGNEYAECGLKAEGFGTAAPDWRLVEAFRPGEQERHLDRMERTAAGLGIAFDRAEASRRLAELVPTGPKVRLTLDRFGSFDATSGPSALPDRALRAAVARSPIPPEDPNLRIKTTSREVYDRFLDEHPEADEVLLHHPDGRVSEFCRGNVVFRFGEDWVTPDPAVGCLDGLGLRRVPQAVRQDVGLDRARTADEVFFVNAVVGPLPVEVDWAIQ